MLGKTHMTVAAASAMAIIPTTSMPTLVVGMGFAALGGLISDVDVSTSKSHNKVEHIVTMSFVTVVIMILLECIFHIGIRRRLMANSNLFRIVIGVSIFIGICGIGAKTAHRSFMHSILAVALLTACVYIVFPLAAPYFMVGMCSHLVIDLLNHRGEKLLYPLPKGFCLNLASSKGLMNRLLFVVAIIVIVGEIIVFCFLK